MEDSELVALYVGESNLIQQKATHILAIRTIAVTIFAGVIAASVAYPGRGLQWLALTIVPLYVLDAVYDGYLLAIVKREIQLRIEIGRRMSQAQMDRALISVYYSEPDHRITPDTWSPFSRTLLEPTRIVLYAALIAAPIIILQFVT